MRILAVDDSKATHLILDAIFSSINADLLHAFNGEEAMAVLSAHICPNFDLILIDWEMPSLSGLETMLQIRKMGIQIPIITMTSKIDSQTIEEALEKGSDDYILKPFAPCDLIERIGNLLLKKVKLG